MNTPMHTPPLLGASQALAMARETLAIEIQSLQALAQRLDESFVQVVQAILVTPGRVVVTGMEKAVTLGARLLPRWLPQGLLPSLCTLQKPAMGTWAW